MRNQKILHQPWLALIALVLAASLLACATKEKSGISP
jgi:hypothetical protein